MRSAHSSNGERLFKSTEFLTFQQISSYFSRLSATTPQQTHEVDLAAIEEEINFSTARDEVMATVTLQHPIMFDLKLLKEAISDCSYQSQEIDY